MSEGPDVAQYDDHAVACQLHTAFISEAESLTFYEQQPDVNEVDMRREWGVSEKLFRLFATTDTYERLVGDAASASARQANGIPLGHTLRKIWVWGFIRWVAHPDVQQHLKRSDVGKLDGIPAPPQPPSDQAGDAATGASRAHSGSGESAQPDTESVASSVAVSSAEHQAHTAYISKHGLRICRALERAVDGAASRMSLDLVKGPTGWYRYSSLRRQLSLPQWERLGGVPGMRDAMKEAAATMSIESVEGLCYMLSGNRGRFVCPLLVMHMLLVQDPAVCARELASATWLCHSVAHETA